MRLILGLLALCATWPALAQDLPALYRVTGVAAHDVLNLRALPSASAPILGSLAPTATGVEVVALSPDGRWGQVPGAEGATWASMRFLAREGDAGWRSGQVPLRCVGTEPFWSVTFFLPTHHAEFFTPDNGGVELVTDAGALPVTHFPPTLAIPFGGAHEGFATIRPVDCSDGMSDRPFGLEGLLYLRHQTFGLSGCCTLVVD